ncbi:hypothetical protein Fmac_026276 [Flemingia macrophylla]|uniref:Uncharacterized protein n=1 Tax=Flemingia macrophylla TaxID=520843 RepID=A0ABD1LEE2_9FABA
MAVPAVLVPAKDRSRSRWWNSRRHRRGMRGNRFINLQLRRVKIGIGPCGSYSLGTYVTVVQDVRRWCFYLVSNSLLAFESSPYLFWFGFGSADNTIHLFDRRNLKSGEVGSPIYKFEGHDAPVLCVQVGKITADSTDSKEPNTSPGLFFRHAGHSVSDDCESSGGGGTLQATDSLSVPNTPLEGRHSSEASSP